MFPRGDLPLPHAHLCRLTLRGRRTQRQDLLGGVLGDDDNGRRRVASQLAREDGRVHHEDVVRPVDLRVGVDHGRAVVAAPVVGAHFGGACET